MATTPAQEIKFKAQRAAKTGARMGSEGVRLGSIAFAMFIVISACFEFFIHR